METTLANSVLITGETNHPDFAGLFPSRAEFLFCPRLEDAISLARQSDVQAIVLVQSRREPFDRGLVDALLDAAPLAIGVNLIGAWCEGETRSGNPYLGWLRVYWHQWPHFVETLVAELHSGTGGSLNAIRTRSEADQLLDSSASESGDDRRSLVDISVAVCARWNSEFQFLADAIAELGGRAWRLERESEKTDSTDAVLVVGDGMDDEFQARWMERRQACLAIPAIALLGFPRPQDVERARQLGFTEVLSKPFRLDGLQDCLRRSLRPRSIPLVENHG